jgi:ferredoxin
MPQVHIDQDECIACESCVELCPNAFAMDDDLGKAKVITSSHSEECIQEAIDTCPVECISWVD